MPKKKNRRIPQNVHIDKNGNWEIRVTFKDKTGKRRTVSEKCDKGLSAKDVKAKVAEIKQKIFDRLSGAPRLEKKDYTVAEFLELWLSRIKSKLAPRTFEIHSLYAAKIPDSLGNLPLEQLTNERLSAHYDELVTQDKLWLAVYLHKTLNAAFRKAVEWKMIVVNPCAGASVPALPRNDDLKAMTDGEARRFLAAARNYQPASKRSVLPVGLIFELALETGARPEEYLALRWSDLDFARRLVFIRRTVITVDSVGGFQFGDLKTKSSRRSIELSEQLVEKLKLHREAQTAFIAARREKGRRWENLNLIFATRYGTPASRKNLARREFKEILKAAKLDESFSPYCLRHTCATLLLLEGIHPRVVQERLGHANVQITLDRYSHVLPTMQQQATAALSNLLYKEEEKQEKS